MTSIKSVLRASTLAFVLGNFIILNILFAKEKDAEENRSISNQLPKYELLKDELLKKTKIKEGNYSLRAGSSDLCEMGELSINDMGYEVAIVLGARAIAPVIDFDISKARSDIKVENGFVIDEERECKIYTQSCYGEETTKCGQEAVNICEEKKLRSDCNIGPVIFSHLIYKCKKKKDTHYQTYLFPAEKELSYVKIKFDKTKKINKQMITCRYDLVIN